MNRLADTVAVVEAEYLEDTSRYLKADLPVDTLHDNLVEAEVQTLGKRPSDVKFEAMGILH